MMDWTTFIVTIIGGILVLISYFTVLKSNMGNENYLNSKYWLDLPKNCVYILIILQIVSIIGFFMFLVPWIFIERPKGGVLGNNNWALPLTIGVFMIASFIWSFGVSYSFKNKNKCWIWMTIISLVVAAICSIIFIAGATEEDNPKWYIILGTILFGITIILSDGINWNARFIKKFM